MKILNTQSLNFYKDLNIILNKRSQNNMPVIDEAVKKIIDNVINNGDDALIEYTNKFDNMDVSSIRELEISKERLEASLEKITPEQRVALETAAARV